MLKNTDTDSPEELIEPLKGERCPCSNVKLNNLKHSVKEVITSGHTGNLLYGVA